MRKSDRFKHALQMLFDKNYKNSRLMTCGACGSKNIIGLVGTLVEEDFVEDNRNFHKYEEQSICLDCGAKCIETQYWTDEIPENMEVINEFKRTFKETK